MALAMSLVAYGSSDESEDESSEVEPVQNDTGLGSDLSSPMPSSIACRDVESILEKDEDCVSKPSDMQIQSLFRSLPKPKQNRPICESIDEDEQFEPHPDALGLLAFLPEPQSNSNVGLGLGLLTPRPTIGSGTGKDCNKKMGTVKITLPSLSQFNDETEDEPAKKKLKPSQKGSGLFAILPAPKNIKPRQFNQQPLVPYIFTKSLTPTPNQSKHVKKSLDKVVKPNKPSSPEAAGNDSEDEDKDFFSLNSVNNLSKGALATDCTDSSIDVHIPRFSPMIEVETDAVTGVHSSNEEPLAFHSNFLPSPWANESPLPGPSREGHMPGPTNCQDSSYKSEEEWTLQESNSSFPQENLQLDAEAMQRLCGRRSKKQEPVEFIDVSGKEIMPDPKDWLIKQLSEEQPKMRSHSHKRNDGPTTQQRRKHQITYLAFQAKENELELKNQWSQNRMTRKQTQSKYGF